MPFPRRAQLEYDALREYALRALARRSLSVAELSQRLRGKAAEAGDVQRVIDLLKSYGHLDDRKLAEHYADARAEERSVGSQRVARDLLQKRIQPALVERAVGAAFAGSDETALIEEFLRRKTRGKNLVEWLKEPKNVSSLYRRLRVAGFSGSASIGALKRYARGDMELDALESAESEPGESAD
jgi:SOS response regulatory protein OraA/RecX